VNRSDEWADYLDPTEADPDLPPAHRETLDRFAAALADDATWSDPPPGLRGALLDLAMQEGPVAPDGSSPATGPLPAPRFGDGPGRTPVVARDRRGRRGGTRAADSRRPDGRPRRRPTAARTWWLSAAGVAAAAVLVVALAWPRPHTTTFAMHGTAASPRATATARLEPRSAGLAITLEIKGLPPAPAGSYYAAWLRGPDGVVPVGTFHWRKGGIPIDLWSGVLTDHYPVLFVTLQREGQPPTPSTQIVLTGTATGN
jgi:hypothetical protein